MRVYIVAYDLRKKGKDYIGLSEQLKFSPGWWHYLDSTWLIVTQEDANQLCRRLKPHIDEQEDRILVIEAGTDSQGWLPEDAWKWIQRVLLGQRV
jgi:hypothetical protein